MKGLNITMSHDTVTMAVNYVHRGWRVTLLHDVSNGTCSCGRTECDNGTAGKHPVAKGWQAHPLDNEPAVRAAWAARPMANVGIVTGAISGIWVLDVDPLNGGSTSLAELIERYGPLPETYTVYTGSGGTHYYWEIPEWEPHNAQASGALAAGLDVRGWHGQVVAPPSISGKGEYKVAADIPVAPAPAWLLDLIRPKAPPAPPAYNPGPIGGVWQGPGLQQWPTPASNPGQVIPHQVAVESRGPAYAQEAASQLLYAMSTAPAGSRNETGFRVAARLVELANARWSGIDHAAAAAAFASAARSANVDGRFGDWEVNSLWTKATRHVGVKAADLPPADWLGEGVEGWGLPRETVDFSGAGLAGTRWETEASRSTVAPSVGAMTSGPGQYPPYVDPFSDPGPLAPGPAGLPSGSWSMPLAPMSPLELQTQKAMLRIKAERDAKERLKLLDAPVPSFLPQLLEDEQMDLIPPPQPLVEGWLYRDTLARLWGPSGAGKSHVAIDIAASVATGRPWHGVAVQRGTVAYMVAEGVPGMGPRRRAWQKHHGVGRTGIRWLPFPVQTNGLAWDRFVADMATLGPVLIILDTQARVTEGVEENSNTEMGLVVAALERLRAATGACVLLVHHQGAGDSDRARGATSVKGAMATEMSVSRRRGIVVVANPKQKDAAEAPALDLVLTTVELEGEPSSVVLLGVHEPVIGPDGFADPTQHAHTVPLNDRRALAMVEVMRESFAGGSGGTKAEVIATWLAHPSNEGYRTGSLRTAAYRVWTRLEELGRIAANPMSKAKFKYVEIEGVGALDANPEPSLTDDRGWHVVKQDRTKAERPDESKIIKRVSSMSVSLADTPDTNIDDTRSTG